MAITWLSKDPDEVDTRAHDFSGLLDDGEGVTSYELARIAGTVTATRRAVAGVDTLATIDISGGADRETSIFEATIVTDSTPARTLQETIILPVVSTSSSALVQTGYVAPTVANLKAMFPNFAGSDVAAVQMALDEAAGQVDTSWLEGDFAMGRLLYAAHVLTTNGHGTGAAAQVSGLAGVKRIKSGALDLEFADKAASASMLQSTSYGQRFATLQRQNTAGGFVTRIVNGCCLGLG